MSDQNDTQTHTSEPIEGKVIWSLPDEQKVALVIVGGATFFLAVRFAAKTGVKSGMKPLMKELRMIADNVPYNAQVTYDNVQATIDNGNIILDAIRKAQPAIDAINAVQGR